MDTLMTSYTVCRYRSVNPTVFCSSAFLVMFGLMFPDVWHGFVLVFFATLMRRFGDDLRRWTTLVTLLGFSSIFSGVLFNSIFSKALLPIELSQWRVGYSPSELLLK